MNRQIQLASLLALSVVAAGCSGSDGGSLASDVGGAQGAASGGAKGSSSSQGNGGAISTAVGGSTTGSSNEQKGGASSSGGSTNVVSASGGSATGGSNARTSSVVGSGGSIAQTSTKGIAGRSSQGGAAGQGQGGVAVKGGASGLGGSVAGAGRAATTSGGLSSVAGSSSSTEVQGTAGSSAGKLCKFPSGLNVAWVSFASDVPNPNITTFSKIFKDTYDNGGRIVRWWFHTNGTSTPGYNSDGTVKKIQQSHIDDVKKILAAANAAKIGVVISLWSFDMAQDNAGTAATQNQALLTTDSLRQSYIDNYLTDLVKGLKGTPGLYAYEIFNEPEGMETTGWATKFKLDKKYIQMAVNWWSAAIHAADPTIPVTSSAQTMDSCSGVTGKRNDYSDSALTSVGGKSTGTLDFYEVHYYQVNGESDNIFANPRSHWNLNDKKLVIGEFAAYSNDTSPVAVNDSFTYLYNNGYDGAWAWSYTEGNSNYAWPSMKTPMSNLYTAQKATIDACP